MKVNTVDLSDVELEDKNSSSQSEAQLEQEYNLGQIVDVEDEGPGIVAAFVEESFEFPVGATEDRMEEIEEEDEEPEMEEIDASSDNPMYIIALQDGGSVAASADEIRSGTLEGDDGADIESWDDMEGEAGEAELAPVYEYCDDPSDQAELDAAKRDLIHERQAAALADYVESGEMELSELEDLSVEELVNIRGVDDPHVGLNRLPDGWTRKSVLQAWASLGAQWRTAYAHFLRAFPPERAKRMASAYKDEVLRTEMWRGKF